MWVIEWFRKRLGLCCSWFGAELEWQYPSQDIPKGKRSERSSQSVTRIDVAECHCVWEYFKRVLAEHVNKKGWFIDQPIGQRAATWETNNKTKETDEEEVLSEMAEESDEEEEQEERLSESLREIEEDLTITNCCLAMLGLPEDATVDDVKKRYRELALRFHPDVNPTGENEFRQIKEAYEAYQKFIGFLSE